MSELRVAVAMGGGVSLGSFCGGALGEVVKQLLENRAAAYEGVRFDVFSGASAGAMSLGLMIHTLAHPEFRGSADAVLDRQWEAWVERIDIRDLIPDPEMRSVSSLLDRGAVDRIARDLLEWQADVPPVADVLGRRVLFACTLANLNGIAVDGRRAGQSEAFLDALQTTLYEDLRVFDLRLDGADARGGRSSWVVHRSLSRPEAWRQIAGTCVAAGGFPFAFEPVPLERRELEYGPLWPAALRRDGIDSFPFTFADGGMFNNEPLREVMDLVGRMDAEEGDFERLVVFIDPNLSGTSDDLSLDYYRELEIRDPDNTLWRLGRLFDGRDVERREPVERLAALAAPLVGAVKGQAAFKDWLAAEKVNNRLAWREELRTLVVELVERAPDEAFRAEAAGEGLGAEVRRRLEGVLRAKEGRSVQGNTALDLRPEEVRIRREMGGRLDGLDGSKRTACVHLLSLLDQVAGLRGRQRVRVLGIGPLDENGDPLELAGDFVANFGGFFSRTFREHDYRIGRARAGALLSGAGLVEDPSRVFDDVGPRPDRAGSGSTPEAGRLRERIKHVVGAFLDVKLDWPLKLDKLAIGLAKGRLGAVVRRSLAGDGERARPCVVRLEIAAGDGVEGLELRGFSGGDALKATEEDGGAVLETLIFWTPATRELSGPHVTGKNGRFALEIVRPLPFRRDERRLVALPGGNAFEALERRGYGKLVATVRWAELGAGGEDEVGQVPWEAREILEGWDGRGPA